LWLWLLLVLALAALAVVVVWAMLFPVRRITVAGGVPTAAVDEAPLGATAAPAVTKAVAVATAEIATAVVSVVDEATAAATVAELATTTADTPASVDVVIGIVITPTFVFDPGANLLQNGDFSADWINGWARQTSGQPGIVEVQPAADAPGMMIRLGRAGPGMEQIGQRVVLTTPVEGLTFRARVRQTGARDGTDEGRSAVVLRYEDAAGVPLGASIWLDDSAADTELLGVDPLPAPDTAVVTHTMGEGWQALEVALGEELRGQLPALDPVAVRQVTILLVVLGGQGCGPADCAATLDAAGLSLSADG
jgi:hypothetical protein